MKREIKTTRDVLETLFCNYSANTEQEQIALNIVAHAADTLAMIADALECNDPNTEAARACLLRIEDQLRFAVALEVGDVEVDEPEVASRQPILTSGATAKAEGCAS